MIRHTRRQLSDRQFDALSNSCDPDSSAVTTGLERGRTLTNRARIELGDTDGEATVLTAICESHGVPGPADNINTV